MTTFLVDIMYPMRRGGGKKASFAVTAPDDATVDDVRRALAEQYGYREEIAVRALPENPIPLAWRPALRVVDADRLPDVEAPDG